MAYTLHDKMIKEAKLTDLVEVIAKMYPKLKSWEVLDYINENYKYDNKTKTFKYK